MAVEFTEAERRILRIVQADLPDSLTPYADIAREVGDGVTEQMVIDLLSRLRESGAIRRFGVCLRHQHAGWTSNFMVAWACNAEEAEKLGPIAAKNARVSHCYFRPTCAEDWPYELYTMVHGRSDEECQATVAELRESMGLDDFLILKTKRELKKISPTYF